MLYIPIIGTISSGKSTFLKAFLGINMLQTGVTTTTKFVCLIKHSETRSFYHVIPKKEKGLIFVKEGEEIKDEEEIKKRIENINENLNNKKITIDELFYMLETPIKNINNQVLLENCYFMDIPGLNENNTTYINDIFSIITINDILFEIMVFDSTSIGSDNILNIFKELEKKNCLKKNNNLYILNKIDQCTKGGEGDIIDSFKNYFYKEFEDEKKQSNILINFSENYFIPMNSLLYDAEKNIKEDFYSLLLFELFSYSEYNDKNEFSNFFEFLQKRIESIIIHQNIDIEKIEKKTKKIKDDNDKEMEIIINSVEKLKKINKNILSTFDIQIGIKLEKNNVKKELKKLFLIQKEQLYYCYHSNAYNQLQEIISKIIINKNDLSSPPCVVNSENKNLIFKNENKNIINKKLNNIKKNSKKNEDKNMNDDITIYEDLEKFINETFKLIDPTNELGDFKYSLNTLRENILGRKIRISMIGNISVGKSTVLNSIIGEKILPTKETECTYRGVIIRNKNIDDFELYRSKLVSKGIGLEKYYFFQEANYPYTRGIKNIKSYLNNKNNDKEISDDDAFIIIAGKLKIFDFIKLEKKLIDKIEFIDLPGPDRKDNSFNDKKYYEKILKFSNCCIYINEPKTINDQESVNRMRAQYISDKLKINISLRENFIKTCLFLINKSDSLEDNKDKEKIKANLLQIIPEKKLSIKDINISFFSGKSFLEYLEYYYKFVYMIELNPLFVLNCLYDEYNSQLILKGNFKNYLKNKIFSKIEEKFDIDLDDDISVPDLFNKNLKDAFKVLYKNKINFISDNDENEIIEKLYLININLKNNNFDDTNYSHEFFNSLQNIILYSENLNNKNFTVSLEFFFSNADDLFKKEIKKENEKEIKENNERIEFIRQTILPKTDELFEEKKKKVIDIIDLTKYKCIDIYDKEIKDIDQIFEENNNDLQQAAKNLEEKIKIELDNMQKNQENEAKSLINEIEKLLKDNISEFYKNKNINNSSIDINIGLTLKMVISLFTSTLTGIGVRTGLVVIAEAILGGVGVSSGTTFGSTAAGALLGPLGIAIGVGVGVVISFATFIHHTFFCKKKRYINGIEDNKKVLKEKLDEYKSSFENDFNDFKDSLIRELKNKIDILKKNILDIDSNKWEEIKKNYHKKKEIIQKKIIEKFKK